MERHFTGRVSAFICEPAASEPALGAGGRRGASSPHHGRGQQDREEQGEDGTHSVDSPPADITVHFSAAAVIGVPEEVRHGRRQAGGSASSGWGSLDRAEIEEAVSTHLSLDRRGVTLVATAPDQPSTTSSITPPSSRQARASRNVPQEAAGTVRGQIEPLGQVKADELDALILPAGSARPRTSAATPSTAPP